MTKLDAVIDRYLKVFRTPVAEVDASFARWVIYGYFIYKLLSRDFSTFGEIPRFLLDLYPVDVYGKSFLALMGTQVVTDLATFHWIHWVLPFPSSGQLQFVQWLATGFCVATCLLGRGPFRIFAIGSYVLLMYLWGFMFRSGSDIDAVFLGLSSALFYCFSSHKECLTIWRPAGNRQRTVEAGWFYSAMIMCFVIYYLASGINKLIDISVVDWFTYDLIQSIELELDRQKAGYFKQIPELFEFLRGQYWINYIGVPLVYLSHLATPMMFYDRRLIPAFWVFYVTFHAMAWGIGILFFGNFILWLAFLPVHRLMERLEVRVNPNNTLGRVALFGITRLDFFRRITRVEPDGPDNICVKAPQGTTSYTGISGLRRLAWSLPLMWPLLPLLYVLGVFHIFYLFLPSRVTRSHAAS
ncbi:hypothetical protein QCN28_15710 [Bordetella bronchiseptica]|uniref:hypothetical protein n=1 Tax=Bordetella bronchiseptica TaxID=518 RepID=UPI003F745A09